MGKTMLKVLCIAGAGWLSVGAAAEYKSPQDRQTDAASAHPNRQLHFENTVVEGLLDRNEAVIIFLPDEPPEQGLVLDRSFKEFLRFNTDRETLQRAASLQQTSASPYEQ